MTAIFPQEIEKSPQFTKIILKNERNQYNVPMKKKQVILAASLGCAAIVMGSLAFFPSLAGRAGDGPNSSWMADVAENTPLRQLTIPGTHDTVARYSVGDVAGRCQDLGIRSQLNIGVRFFDLRLSLDSGKLKGVHSYVDEKISMDKIMKQFDGFLADHPTETLLVSVKDEGKVHDGFDEAVKTAFEGRLVDFDLDLRMGDCRGKMVLFARYANNTVGTPCHEGWEDGGDPVKETIFRLPNNILVQDHYKLPNIETKTTEISKTLDMTADEDAFALNFFSGYKGSGFPPSYSVSVSKYINPQVGELLEGRSHCGVCIVDFASAELVNTILEANQ